MEVDDSLLMDSRVLKFWDNDREVGLWFAQQKEYRDLIGGPLAWDTTSFTGQRRHGTRFHHLW